jgi:hypothetical protein
VPALSPYIIEPIWEQFAALLPERKAVHPLGCHRPRVPDGVVFENLREAGAGFGLRLRLVEDSRWLVLGHHARPPRWAVGATSG